MSEFKGTKGPWFGLKGGRYDNSKNTWDLHNHDGEAACSTSAPITTENGDVVAFVVHSSDEYYHGSMVDDNARLIAAAPDLLEAAQMAINHYDEYFKGIEVPEDLPWVPVVRAAIAKALGTEHNK